MLIHMLTKNERLKQAVNLYPLRKTMMKKLVSGRWVNMFWTNFRQHFQEDKGSFKIWNINHLIKRPNMDWRNSGWGYWLTWIWLLLINICPPFYPQYKHKLSSLWHLTSLSSYIISFLPSTSWHHITHLLLFHTVAGTKSLAPVWPGSIRFLEFLKALCWSAP